MNQEQTKERIKLKTEFLKFYFILVVAIGTAIITLGTRDVMSNPQKVFLGIGVTLLAFFIVLIVRLRVEIHSLIKRLE